MSVVLLQMVLGNFVLIILAKLGLEVLLWIGIVIFYSSSLDPQRPAHQEKLRGRPLFMFTKLSPHKELFRVVYR